MAEIILTNTKVCVYNDDQRRDYVFYTGGIAGVSDRPGLQSDSETLQRSTDEVKLDRD